MPCPIASRFMGGSTSFNGSTSKILAALPFNKVDGFAMGAWVRAGTPTSDHQSIIGIGAGLDGYVLSLSASGGGAGGGKYVTCNYSGVGFKATDFEATVGQWVHLAVVKNGTLQFYINGEAYGSAQSGTPNVPTTGMGIGAMGSSSRLFRGNLAEPFVIGVAPTPTEIRNLYRYGELPDGATNFWKLDDLPSTYTDSIGGNTGTGTATTYSPDTPTQARVSVQRGSRSLSLSSSSTYIEIPHNALYSSNTFTLESLHKLRTAVASSTIISKYDGTNGFVIGLDGSGKYQYGFKTSNTWSLYGTTIAPKLNVFERVELAYDGVAVKLYIDGQLRTSNAETDLVGTNTGVVRVGYDTHWGAGASNGLFKTQRMWNTALTAQQIRDLHFNGIVPRDGLVGEWDADNLSADGTTIPDTSGQGNTATVTGAVASTDVPPYMTPVGGLMAIQDGSASVAFDGVDDYIEVPDAALPATAFQSGFVLFGKIKPKGAGETAGRIFDKCEATAGTNGFASFVGTTKLVGLNVNGGTTISSNPLPKFGDWYHWVCNVSASAVVSHYINGVLSGTPAATGALSGITTTNAMRIGNRATATDRTFDGNMKDMGILSLAGRGDLTKEEVANLAYYGIIPTGTKLLNLPMNEGAGATVYDTSGNGNHGTLSSPTTMWSADLPPYMIRGGNLPDINGNMILNGDFSYVPPFTAPTTTDDVWINGAAAGTASIDAGKLFHWAHDEFNANGTVQYDTSVTRNGKNSMKINVVYAAGGCTVAVRSHRNYSANATDLPFLVPVSPLTEYVLSAYVKTGSIAGATPQVYLRGLEYVSALGNPTNRGTNKITTENTDWTLCTVTFTTGATARYFGLDMLITGGAALDATAWFSDIQLRPTTPITLTPLTCP